MIGVIVIRKRTPVWLMIYGVYVYFSSTSFRRASRILEPWVKRSYVALWSWVQRFSHIADHFKIGRECVECFLVDETMIRVGSLEAWLWVALDPENRKFLGFYISRTRNILVAHMFLRWLVKRYGRKPLYTDEAVWYPAAARWNGLKHYVYEDDLKNVMERFIETVKDRLECFDDYFPCLKEHCNCSHVHNWFSVYALLYNQVRVHTTLGSPPLGELDDIEAIAFQNLITKTLS